MIIPVYNVEAFLEQCIDSVLSQTYENLQIIIVDDGTTDSSGDICDLFKTKDQRIEVIHKANGGLSDARNAGINNARGEYVTFVDSDDFIRNNMIETLLNLSVSMMQICLSVGIVGVNKRIVKMLLNFLVWQIKLMYIVVIKWLCILQGEL